MAATVVLHRMDLTTDWLDRGRAAAVCGSPDVTQRRPRLERPLNSGGLTEKHNRWQKQLLKKALTGEEVQAAVVRPSVGSRTHSAKWKKSKGSKNNPTGNNVLLYSFRIRVWRWDQRSRSGSRQVTIQLLWWLKNTQSPTPQHEVKPWTPAPWKWKTEMLIEVFPPRPQMTEPPKMFCFLHKPRKWLSVFTGRDATKPSKLEKCNQLLFLSRSKVTFVT